VKALGIVVFKQEDLNHFFLMNFNQTILIPKGKFPNVMLYAISILFALSIVVSGEKTLKTC
jgi:hypothetical protein